MQEKANAEATMLSTSGTPQRCQDEARSLGVIITAELTSP
jgi:hypothetical protein